MPPARCERRRSTPSASRSISSCARRAGRAGQLEAVADLDALDRLDAHQRAGQPGVQPAVPLDVAAQAGRQAVHHHLDHAAQGVAGPPGLVDVGDHRGGRPARPGSAPARRRSGPGHRAPAACRPAPGPSPIAVDVAEHLDAGDLGQERLGHRAERHPGRGLPRAGPFQHRTGVVQVVLLHADQIGVTGPGPGQRLVAGLAGQQLGVHRVGRHHGLPLGPLGVADPDRHRAAHGPAVPDAAGQLHLVLLELHPGAAAVAEPAPGQLGADGGGVDADPGRQPLEDGHQRGPVRLTSGHPAQHHRNSRRPRAGPRAPEAGMMDVVDESAGWRLDPDLLRPVLTDRRIGGGGAGRGRTRLDRLFLLPLLGRVEQALAEAEELLADRQVRGPLAGAAADRGPAPLAARTRPGRAAADRGLEARPQPEPAGQHPAPGRQALVPGRRRWTGRGLLRAGADHAPGLRRRRARSRSSELALAGCGERLGFDAIVLAGGRGSRLRAAARLDKPGLPLAGWPLVDHVLLAASGASNRIVVGPHRMALASPVFCREQPAGAGPVAAIAAGGRAGFAQPTVAVLAADLPFIGPALDAAAPVRDAGQPARSALLVDTTGRSNYLAAVWRTSALLQALDALGDPANLPVRALYQGRDIGHVPDFDALGADCDTPHDLRTAQERISAPQPGAAASSAARMAATGAALPVMSSTWRAAWNSSIGRPADGHRAGLRRRPAPAASARAGRPRPAAPGPVASRHPASGSAAPGRQRATAPGRRPGSRPGWSSRATVTGTPSRSAVAAAAPARAGSRTSTVTRAGRVRARPAPPGRCRRRPSSTTSPPAGTSRSASASRMPSQSVLSACQPSGPGSSVLPAPIAAACGLALPASSSSRRLSGMVQEKPATPASAVSAGRPARLRCTRSPGRSSRSGRALRRRPGAAPATASARSASRAPPPTARPGCRLVAPTRRLAPGGRDLPLA